MNNRALLTFLSGLGAGFALLLACGDDTPSSADAQVACDCPAAEAPLTAARFEIRTAPRVVPAGQPATQGTGCIAAAGEILISGGCFAEGTVPDVDLIQSNFDVGGGGNVWRCSWRNNTAADVMAEVQVKCLLPAQ